MIKCWKGGLDCYKKKKGWIEILPRVKSNISQLLSLSFESPFEIRYPKNLFLNPLKTNRRTVPKTTN